METAAEILTLAEEYIKKFPAEYEEVKPLVEFVRQYDGEDLIDRKNFTGHLTTSAFIIDENAEALLLLKHKSLNRWLQPGGHVDVTDASLQSSALREACEETGLATTNLILLSNHIFDIDSHAIPANPKKHEPAHVHHDIRFLFQCADAKLISISLEESTDSKWIPFTELNDNEDFDWVEEKVSSLIQQL